MVADGGGGDVDESSRDSVASVAADFPVRVYVNGQLDRLKCYFDSAAAVAVEVSKPKDWQWRNCYWMNLIWLPFLEITRRRRRRRSC